jgi:hypothetical protein
VLAAHEHFEDLDPHRVRKGLEEGGLERLKLSGGDGGLA